MFPKSKNSESIPDDDRVAAQRIHTEAYLRSGFIDESQLDTEGLYTDEYTERADPIVVKIGQKATAIRVIHGDKQQGGLLSLPTVKNFSLEPNAVRDVARVTRLSDIRAADAVEISGLGSVQSDETFDSAESLDATRQAYAKALRLSLDQGHKLWLMNIDEKLKNYLDLILGKGLINQVGEEATYMGPPTIPAVANPQTIVTSILSKKDGRFAEENKEDVRAALAGVNERYLTRELKSLLKENNIPITEDNVLSKLWRNRKAAFYTGIVAYSALRFVPVGFVEQFNGSVGLYAAIDVATAVTQVGSMEVMFKSKTRTKRALGALGTAVSFVLPYVYFYANGEDYPWFVNAVAGGFVGVSVYAETSKSLKDRKLKNGLEQSPSRES